KGTLRGLDPHSSFLDPEMYREMQVETSGSFGGLGIEITLKDDVLTVVAPIEGTPAYRAGILSGDRIVKIEGLSTKDMQLTDAVKRMRGKPGSKIVIGIVREGWTEPKDFTITREQIRVQSVKHAELEPGIEDIRRRQRWQPAGSPGCGRRAPASRWGGGGCARRRTRATRAGARSTPRRLSGATRGGRGLPAHRAPHRWKAHATGCPSCGATTSWRS